MYSNGKYIVGEISSEYGLDTLTAICFNEVVGHKEVAPIFKEIYGAGFFVVEAHEDGELRSRVYGKSIGLGVESRGEKDSKQVDRALGLNP